MVSICKKIFLVMSSLIALVTRSYGIPETPLNLEDEHKLHICAGNDAEG